MSARDGGPLHFLEVTSRFGPGDVGTVFGGVVYHNFYSTRFAATPLRCSMAPSKGATPSLHGREGSGLS